MPRSFAVAIERVRALNGLAPWQLKRVRDYIDTHLADAITNRQLAGVVRLSVSHFGRAFRLSTGSSPHSYVLHRRIERAQLLMLSTDAKLTQIAFECGLSDQAHLSRLFLRTVGETPRAWRRARFDPGVAGF